MRGKNLGVLGVLLLLIGALFAAALWTRGNSASGGELYAVYRLAKTGEVRALPLPKDGVEHFSIRQGDGTENVLKLMPNGFCMESSTCANQDCVRQGDVTTENRATRILQNSVICLPNQVIVELYTAQELEKAGIEEGMVGENE
ncbi:MAG: NusG domain II-containing protein [Christensenellales bacterium]|jgi:hypothetical protein